MYITCGGVTSVKSLEAARLERESKLRLLDDDDDKEAWREGGLEERDISLSIPDLAMGMANEDVGEGVGRDHRGSTSLDPRPSPSVSVSSPTAGTFCVMTSPPTNDRQTFLGHTFLDGHGAGSTQMYVLAVLLAIHPSPQSRWDCAGCGAKHHHGLHPKRGHHSGGQEG